MSANSGLYLLLFTLVITTIIIIFRIKTAVQGTKVNVKKTIIFSAYFVAISSFLGYNSFLVGGVPVVYSVPYFAVVVVAAYCSYIYSKRTLSFSKLPSYDGNSVIYVKGGLSIFLLYIAALTIRIAINFLFIGSEKLYFNNQQTILGNGTVTDIMPMVHIDAATTVLALTITDLLLIVGAGLVVGRNASVLKYYYQEKERRMS
ncbi:MAG: hypothetical protein M3044_13330 [Thermoproteota archaeon]|nr:hypothetical protein [Thermoproteota archaeon]